MKLRQMLTRLLAATVVVAAPLAPLALMPTQAQAAPRDPVVIVPGLFGNGPGAAQSGYTYLQQRLEYAGFDTYVFVAPDYGVGDIHANAARLGAFVADVLTDTGATQVDIVAHSQGGVMARDYIKTLGGAAKTDSLVMYGASNYGSKWANLANAWGANCFNLVGCSQLAIGSSFLNALNAGDDSIGDVVYTSIATQYDSVMTPYTNAFLNAADGNITNINVQSQCPFRYSDHMSVTNDGTVIDGVVDALKDQPVSMNCYAV